MSNRPPEEVFCKYRVPLVQYFGKRIRPWGENKLLYSVTIHLTAWRLRACLCHQRAHLSVLLQKKCLCRAIRFFEFLRDHIVSEFRQCVFGPWRVSGRVAFPPSLLCFCSGFFPITYIRLAELGSTLQCEIMSQSSRACLLGLFGILWLEKGHPKVNEVSFSLLHFFPSGI